MIYLLYQPIELWLSGGQIEALESEGGDEVQGAGAGGRLCSLRADVPEPVVGPGQAIVGKNRGFETAEGVAGGALERRGGVAAPLPVFPADWRRTPPAVARS